MLCFGANIGSQKTGSKLSRRAASHCAFLFKVELTRQAEITEIS